MPRLLTSMACVLPLLLGAQVALAQPAAPETVALDGLELLLDRAVARVSRASVQVAQRGSSTRGYLLAGYGALFVVPPRALPTAGRAQADAEATRAFQQATRHLEEALQRVEDPTLRLRIQASLEALRAAQADRPALLARRRAEEAQKQALERQMQAQMEALQQEAERAQAEAERAMQEMQRQLQSRLAAPVAAVPAVPAQPPQPPAAPLALPLAPAPPWSFWFEVDEEDGAASPDRLMRDVGAAVAEVFAAKGAGLAPVKNEEFLAAAVDFFPRGAFAPRMRPQRTLLVRVKKQDLLARQAGRLTEEELRRRVEFLEY